MGIQFASNWKVADPYYTKRYGEYQAFLDSISQQQIMQALRQAKDQFSHFKAHPWVKQILEDASASPGTRDVTVEQGVHQPEDLRSGGFTLHFTMRDNSKRAYHFYIGQQKNGSIYINEVSWIEQGRLQRAFPS